MSSFLLTLPGKNVRRYGDVITKFSRIYSFPFSLGYGASLASGGSAMFLLSFKCLKKESSS